MSEIGHPLRQAAQKVKPLFSVDDGQHMPHARVPFIVRGRLIINSAAARRAVRRRRFMSLIVMARQRLVIYAISALQIVCLRVGCRAVRYVELFELFNIKCALRTA